jgi:hypothetical protein
MVPATAKPGRSHGARIASMLGLLLLVASGVNSSDSGDRALWGSRQKEADAMRAVTLKPSRPRRPKYPNNSTDSGGGQTNGVIPGLFVESFTGETSVPVDQLPIIKPDGVPRDPRYRAAKAAWKVCRSNRRTDSRRACVTLSKSECCASIHSILPTHPS